MREAVLKTPVVVVIENKTQGFTHALARWQLYQGALYSQHCKIICLLRVSTVQSSTCVVFSLLCVQGLLCSNLPYLSVITWTSDPQFLIGAEEGMWTCDLYAKIHHEEQSVPHSFLLVPKRDKEKVLSGVTRFTSLCWPQGSGITEKVLNLNVNLPPFPLIIPAQHSLLRNKAESSPLLFHSVLPCHTKSASSLGK